MASEGRIQLERWVKSLDIKADRVLDVGGSQLPIEGRTNSWDVKEYLISDIEEPHHCKRKPDLVFDLNKLVFFTRKGSTNQDVGIEQMEKSDIVFCLEVTEYLYDPMMAMRNLANFLKDGGTLYISFQFSYGVHPPAGVDYLRYTRFGAVKLLEEAGFQIDEIVARTCQMNTGYPEYMNFMSKQRMRYDKSYPHMETGFMIKAKKL